MTKKILAEQNGFTLMEMIIYMGIFLILLLVLTEIFISVLDVQSESWATSSVEQDGRFVLSRLFYDIHKADSIVTPANLGEENATLQIIVEGINYTYSLSDNNLQLSNNNGTDKLNSFDTTISNFKVKRLGNLNGKNNIQVNFTVTSKQMRPKGPEVKNFQTTIGLR